MKKLTVFFTFICLLGFYTSEAQQVVKKDTLNGTELNVVMDAQIDNLLSSAEAACNRSAASKYKNTNSDSNSGSSYNDGVYTPHINKVTPTKTPKINIPSRALSDADICRQNPRILGYKIQLAVVKSNDEAQKVKAYFRNRFPSIKTETDASLRPNYKILAGSYFSKESASADLRRIRQVFPSANAVQYRVFCVEAK